MSKRLTRLSTHSESSVMRWEAERVGFFGGDESVTEGREQGRTVLKLQRDSPECYSRFGRTVALTLNGYEGDCKTRECSRSRCNKYVAGMRMLKEVVFGIGRWPGRTEERRSGTREPERGRDDCLSTGLCRDADEMSRSTAREDARSDAKHVCGCRATGEKKRLATGFGRSRLAVEAIQGSCLGCESLLYGVRR